MHSEHSASEEVIPPLLRNSATSIRVAELFVTNFTNQLNSPC